MAINIEKIKADLESYGIKNPEKIYYNPSYEELFEHEMDRPLKALIKAYYQNWEL